MIYQCCIPQPWLVRSEGSARSSRLHRSRHCSSYSWHSGAGESSPEGEHVPGGHQREGGGGRGVRCQEKEAGKERESKRKPGS